VIKIRHGITGNYYAMSETKTELIELTKEIGKSSSSIRWNEKFGTWTFRVKNRFHKEKLKKIREELDKPRRL
jgi:hypothetical protein